jgi:hypothetical protein
MCTLLCPAKNELVGECCPLESTAATRSDSLAPPPVIVCKETQGTVHSLDVPTPSRTNMGLMVVKATAAENPKYISWEPDWSIRSLMRGEVVLSCCPEVGEGACSACCRSRCSPNLSVKLVNPVCLDSPPALSPDPLEALTGKIHTRQPSLVG